MEHPQPLKGQCHPSSHRSLSIIPRSFYEINPSEGWWEKFIGPGKALDTNQFLIICTNPIGGCYGSTGPSSINPSTGKSHTTHFPIISIFDVINAQYHLLDHPGTKRLYASVGC
jgi:homoserine O-acetyltransferase